MHAKRKSELTPRYQIILFVVLIVVCCTEIV